jgi:hypothetical protein
MEKLHGKKMLKHMFMGGSSFFMEKSLYLTLTSFMNKLNDLFSPYLLRDAIQINKNYFCAMGLTKIISPPFTKMII